MQQWDIGRVRVSRLVESEEPADAEFILPPATPENLAPHAAWLRPHFVTDAGAMLLSIHSFIVESDGARILVDTCVGNDKTSSHAAWHQAQWSYLADLEAAGFPPESIDVVVCTHLHPDHVGWNTRLEGGRWVPTFPRARYLMIEAEVRRWERARDDMIQPMMQESVAPVLDAGLVDFVDTDHALTGAVRLMPTPGHTPHHVSVAIASGGAEAIITGDLMHHPVQCAHSEWGNPADARPETAVETRRDFYRRYADGNTLILGTHFATPTAGYVVSAGACWEFRPQGHGAR